MRPGVMYPLRAARCPGAVLVDTAPGEGHDSTAGWAILTAR